jgi:hypothetical protein
MFQQWLTSVPGGMRGANGRSDPGIGKGTDGRSNFVLDEEARKHP